MRLIPIGVTRLLALAMLLTGGPLFPASVPELGLPALLAGSPRIVHGEVVRRWTAWDDDARYIWTHAEVRILEAVRGGTNRLVVSTPGGTIDGMTMHVPGATAFEEGEEVVVFAYPVPNGLWRLQGWSQGKYRVSETAGGGRLVRAAAGPGQGALPTFLARVRQLIEREGR